MVTTTRNGARFVYFKLGDKVIRETWQGGSLVRRSTLTPRAGLTADDTLRRLEAKQTARKATPRRPSWNADENEITGAKATHTIAGVEFTLTRGVRYLASRPMADGRKVFTVTISHTPGGADVATVDELSYDAANNLLARFNNGPSSWDGRVWA